MVEMTAITVYIPKIMAAIAVSDSVACSINPGKSGSSILAACVGSGCVVEGCELTGWVGVGVGIDTVIGVKTIG